MTKKKRNAAKSSSDEGSEYSGGSHDSDSLDEDENDGTQETTKTAIKEENEEDSTTRTEIKAIGKRQKKRKKKSYDLTAEDELPSSSRKTKNGGYAHTNKSKSRISKANSGNTPWNKGRNRSSADRAKIAAGVRARNRAILLQKLKRLGLTEEEYEVKKREIKYLRERVRRTKMHNKKNKEMDEKLKKKMADAERKLQEAIAATTDTNIKDISLEPEPEPSECPKEKLSKEVAAVVFGKEVVWAPFSFGEVDNDGGGSKTEQQQTVFGKACPNGGPGGLICCDFCAHVYGDYLNSTVQDMETQRTNHNGKEVKELLKFLKEGRTALSNAHDTAKTKIPPVASAEVVNKLMAKTGSRKALPGSKKAVDRADWNITSALDLAYSEGMAAV